MPAVPAMNDAIASRFPWRRAKYFVLSTVFCVGTFVVVSLQEEVQKTRRHSSIERDIEREKWRAKELGKEVKDDGFAEKFILEKKMSAPSILDKAAAATAPLE